MALVKQRHKHRRAKTPIPNETTTSLRSCAPLAVAFVVFALIAAGLQGQGRWLDAVLVLRAGGQGGTAALGSAAPAAAPDPLDPNRPCWQNQYAKSLSLPLEGYGRLADEWIDRRVEIEKNLTGLGQKHNHDRFGAFRTMGSCNSTCIGGLCRRDVSKIACGVDRGSMQAPCVVYSVGGNNQWEFEKDVLEKTPWKVHTFDCTGDETRFKVPEGYGDRLKFHYVCLGTKNMDANKNAAPGSRYSEFWTLEKIQKTLGHNRINLFKVDIERYEFPMFESWPTLSDSRSPGTVLPMQVLVEVHYKTHMPELSVNRRIDWKFGTDMINLQSRFLKMGYAVVVRDDNRRCPHCTELTLVRVRCPPDGVENK